MVIFPSQLIFCSRFKPCRVSCLTFLPSPEKVTVQDENVKTYWMLINLSLLIFKFATSNCTYVMFGFLSCVVNYLTFASLKYFVCKYHTPSFITLHQFQHEQSAWLQKITDCIHVRCVIAVSSFSHLHDDLLWSHVYMLHFSVSNSIK